MIKKEVVETLAKEVMGDEFFIVGITVSSTNVIEVLVDGDNGITIEKCIEISRNIEHNLDRDVEDFQLSVSSAGLGRPFKVYRQYLKNVGERVEVIQPNEKPLSGLLKSVDEKGFEIETTSKEKIEGKKKKQEVTTVHRFQFEAGAEVRNIISFK